MKTRVVKVDAQQPDPAVIEEAAEALRAGKLVAFPTETVYGLGAHALEERAVQKVFDAKGRPATDPLIVHIAHVGQVSQCASAFPANARKLALAFWAGFFFSSRRRHTRCSRDWSSDVCSSDLAPPASASSCRCRRRRCRRA